jgi:hypothetical protein
MRTRIRAKSCGDDQTIVNSNRDGQTVPCDGFSDSRSAHNLILVRQIACVL